MSFLPPFRMSGKRQGIERFCVLSIFLEKTIGYKSSARQSEQGILQGLWIWYGNPGNLPSSTCRIFPAADQIRHQEMGIALALCDKLLEGRGACRVHGGGFGGMVQAFVPLEQRDGFVSGIEKYLGENTAHVLEIRELGAVRIF